MGRLAAALLLLWAPLAAASEPDCAAATQLAADRLDEIPAPRRERADALLRAAAALAAVGVEDRCWEALAEAGLLGPAPPADPIAQALDSISVADPPQQPAAAPERQQGDLR